MKRKKKKMSAEDLYAWMKSCLDFFNLTFHEMDKVDIEFKDDTIIATYENETISLKEEV